MSQQTFYTCIDSLIFFIREFFLWLNPVEMPKLLALEVLTALMFIIYFPQSPAKVSQSSAKQGEYTYSFAGLCETLAGLRWKSVSGEERLKKNYL